MQGRGLALSFLSLFRVPIGAKSTIKTKNPRFRVVTVVFSLSLADDLAHVAENHVVNVEANEIVHHVGYHSPFPLHFTASV